MTRLSPRFARLLLLALTVGPFLAVCLPFVDYVPVFDARVYADCVVAVARGAPFPFGYACATHPTLAWAALVALPVRLFGVHPWALHAMSLALGVWGLLAFRDVVLFLFPGDELLASLAAGALGAVPMLAASALGCNPDLGCAVFFLLALRSLLRNQRTEATAAGVLLTFSKETGLLLWVLLVASWALFAVARAEGSLRDKRVRLLSAWPFLLPAALFAAYSFAARRSGNAALWGHAEDLPLHDVFTRFRLFDPNFEGVLGCTFVLQFMWVASAGVALRALVLAARWAARRSRQIPRAVVLCDVLLFGAVLALSRFRTFLNVRYFVVLYPLLMMSAVSAIHFFFSRARAVRLGFFGVLLALFLGSETHTRDPVSRKLFGTFRFGDHELLRMTSLTRECCGAGRDQLAYNLEHLWLHYLQDEIWTTLRPGPGRGIAMASQADWFVVGPLDRVSRRRSLDPRTADLLPIRTLAAGHLDGWPPELEFLRLPSVDERPELEALERIYRERGRRTWAVDGYELEVVELSRR